MRQDAPDWLKRWNRSSRVVTITLIVAVLAFMLWKAIYP